MIEKTRAYEKVRDPMFICEACREELEEYDTCIKCGEDLNFNNLYCGGKYEHYCEECGEKIVKEQWEKEQFKPIAGQLDLFKDKEK